LRETTLIKREGNIKGRPQTHSNARRSSMRRDMQLVTFHRQNRN